MTKCGVGNRRSPSGLGTSTCQSSPMQTWVNSQRVKNSMHRATNQSHAFLGCLRESLIQRIAERGLPRHEQK